jgi:hypothetical protein
MTKLKQSVAGDAQLGYAVDLYWFGVPDAHQTFHQGKDELRGLQQFDSALDKAATAQRGVARGAVSDLLAAEQPAYRALKAEHDHVQAKLTTARDLVRLAGSAGDRLREAEHAVTMRNITPRTQTVDVYESRTVSDGVDAKGNPKTRTEQVKTGTREDPNPAWHVYNNLAMSTKRGAERAMHELNGAVAAARSLFPSAALAQVDGDLAVVLDYFGQPTFAMWSLDSMQIDDLQDSVKTLHVAAGRLVGQTEQQFAPLHEAVNQQIDARWEALTQAPVPRS